MKISKTAPEFKYLLADVEKKFGKAITTSTDFNKLSEAIEIKNNELVSSSTLKRLWGYVSSDPTPRTTTLNLLSRFVGFSDFSEYCTALRNGWKKESTFFSQNSVETSTLKIGDRVMLSWNPDRTVCLDFLGGQRFKVADSGTSSLQNGDEFETQSFIQGCPLYIAKLHRAGEEAHSYVAGSTNGITAISVSRQ